MLSDEWTFLNNFNYLCPLFRDIRVVPSWVESCSKSACGGGGTYFHSRCQFARFRFTDNWQCCTHACLSFLSFFGGYFFVSASWHLLAGAFGLLIFALYSRRFVAIWRHFWGILERRDREFLDFFKGIFEGFLEDFGGIFWIFLGILERRNGGFLEEFWGIFLDFLKEFFKDFWGILKGF